MDDKTQWMDSREAARLMMKHRNNDLKVSVGGILVPVDNVRYDPLAECIVVELYDGEDLRIALSTDPAP